MISPNSDPRPICVLGMHRSGTSCLAGSLQHAGVHFGEVVTKAPHNKKGNRENLEIRGLNDDVLACSGGDWMTAPAALRWTADHEAQRDEIIQAFCKDWKCWAFKDPRTLLTLDFWRGGGVSFQFVGTFRHPLAVARSLRRRNKKMSLERAFAIWLAYNTELLRNLEKEPFPLINFTPSETNYLRQLETAFTRLGLPIESLNLPNRFFDGALRSESADNADAIESPPEELMHVYRTLERHSQEHG